VGIRYLHTETLLFSLHEWLAPKHMIFIDFEMFLVCAMKKISWTLWLLAGEEVEEVGI
jgi:hypothetical protein